MNALEFILKLTDRFTPAMNAAASVANTDAAKIKQQFDKIGTGGKQMATSVNELRGRLNAINEVKFGTRSKEQFEIATQAAKKLEREIDKIVGKEKEATGGIGGGGFMNTAFALAGGNMISGALMNSGEWIKEGMEKAHERGLLTSKIQANLSSSKSMAGVSEGDLGNWSKDLSSKIHASRNEIMDMQSQLLTFPSITKSTFKSSMGMVADIAAQTHHGLSETAIMFGKAFSSPAEGLHAMRRYGVMFTDQEKEKIQKLQESGNLIGAQKFMLEAIAHAGYAGVAERMFKEDKIAQFNKALGAIQLKIGGMVLALKEHLADAFMHVLSVVKNVVHWMKEHKIIMAIIGGVITTVVAGLIIYKSIVGVISTVTKIWGAMTWLVTTPLAWIPMLIIAIILIIAAACVAFKGWGTLWDNVVKFMKGVWSVFVDEVKVLWLEFQNDFLNGIELIEKGWYHLKSLWDKEGAANGLAQINNEQTKRAEAIAKAKGVRDQDLKNALQAGKDALILKGMSVDHGALDKMKNGLKSALGLDKKPGTETAGSVAENAGANTPDSTKADEINSGGQRSVVINIGKMIEKLEQHIIGGGKEAADQTEDAIKEVVRRVIYSMTNTAS